MSGDGATPLEALNPALDWLPAHPDSFADPDLILFLRGQRRQVAYGAAVRLARRGSAGNANVMIIRGRADRPVDERRVRHLTQKVCTLGF